MSPSNFFVKLSPRLPLSLIFFVKLSLTYLFDSTAMFFVHASQTFSNESLSFQACFQEQNRWFHAQILHQFTPMDSTISRNFLKVLLTVHKFLEKRKSSWGPIRWKLSVGGSPLLIWRKCRKATRSLVS